VLEAKGLAKRYRARTVVRDFSFRLDPGEVVGLLGPNGAGKTTCFYMVVGLVPADAGTIALEGRDITHLPMHERARLGVGYLPQEPSVFRSLTVAENVLAILELRDDLDRRQRMAERDRLLEELQVSHLADSKGVSLSGGERARFMLLDEPFAGVDPISVHEIQRIVTHLRSRGIGVLITDHNVRETLGIVDRAYILNAGAVLAEGKPQALLEDPRVREVYLGHDFKL
jgi:lipopolysaccharide export system ATP-binding protein